MKNFQLNLKFSFPEISGASGLYYSEDQIFILSDDSQVLYRYDTTKEVLHVVSLLPSGELQEHLPKKIKPDFEVMVFHEGKLYLFGSGSGAHRFTGVRFDLNNQKSNYFSLRELYSEMIHEAAISPEDLNIEGAVIKGKDIWLFNRGNGPTGQNGIFAITNWEQKSSRESQFRPVTLPSLSGRMFTFSDAVFWKDQFLFLATAEETDNTYDDGGVLGSAIGIINPDNYEVEDFKIITRDYKLEGITLLNESDSSDSFLVCDDSDGDGRETHIFELQLFH